MPEADLLAAVESAAVAVADINQALARWRLDILDYQKKNREYRLAHPEEGWTEDADLWLPYNRPVSASAEARAKADLATAIDAYVRARQPGWKVRWPLAGALLLVDAFAYWRFRAAVRKLFR